MSSGLCSSDGSSGLSGVLSGWVASDAVLSTAGVSGDASESLAGVFTGGYFGGRVDDLFFGSVFLSPVKSARVFSFIQGPVFLRLGRMWVLYQATRATCQRLIISRALAIRGFFVEAGGWAASDAVPSAAGVSVAASEELAGVVVVGDFEAGVDGFF